LVSEKYCFEALLVYEINFSDYDSDDEFYFSF